MNNLNHIREQFNSIVGSHLHYLDSAATTLKPSRVAKRIGEYYNFENGSPHRGAHRLSVLSTQLYNDSKRVVAEFIGASKTDKIIYTRNTTEALNLIASSIKPGTLSEGDRIVIPITSHHSNILPWQRLAKQTGAELVYLYTDEQGRIKPEEYNKINQSTKIISVPLISNGIGIAHDIEKLLSHADRVGAIKIVDAAQAVGHMHVNFESLGCDFLAFSGHKLYGPQGIGVLVGKERALNQLDPFLLGGDMIEYVTEQSASYADLPERFEAGTQNVAGAVGLAEAIKWLNEIGLSQVIAHNKEMTRLLYEMLSSRPDIEVYGPTNLSERGSVVTFNIVGIHPHDVASILDHSGVAIRAGHHCCQPLMAYNQTHATCRASVGIYTNAEDIRALEQALTTVQEVFKRHA